MTLLAIDTSTEWGSIAVFDGTAVLAEQTWRARRHDDALFPSIERLLELVGLSLPSIDRVAVAIGPGSFTGVRIAIAAAQGIARGSGAATIGVPTLDVVAHPHSASRLRVCAVLPAGRRDRYAALYRARGGTLERRTPIFVGSVAELATRIAVDTLFAGEVDAETERELRERLGARAIFPPLATRARRAGSLAELGWARLASGERARPGALEPIYVKPPAIRGPSGELVAERERAVAPAARGER
ncbi:MAG: tRNA (adenosine(37)-N6)-threonylcarbamoyltransferase complex dimerization subunit type 1 TsaB [Chloroflexota bacterium]